MLEFTTSKDTEDFLQILALQQSNLAKNISEQEKQAQGFVTVHHSLDDLQEMHLYEPNIIAKQGDILAAYVLAMTQNSAHNIPILKPMFEIFDHVYFKNKLIAHYKYMVVGQVCVAKDFRGQGLFDEIYHVYRKKFAPNYEICVTEIAFKNTRSMAAHKRVGFEQAHEYTDEGGTHWCVVVWNWNNL